VNVSDSDVNLKRIRQRIGRRVHRPTWHYCWKLHIAISFSNFSAYNSDNCLEEVLSAEQHDVWNGIRTQRI